VKQLSKDDQSQYLLISSESGVQGAYSGYTQIARHLGRSQVISEVRSQSVALRERLADAVLSRLSGSWWYRMSSFRAEREAIRRFRRQRVRILHYLWADRDWGYIDLWPPSLRPSLCATFHGCSDTFHEIVHHRHRLKNFSAIILVSETQRDFFVESGFPTERLFVIPHGVDCEYFQPSGRPRVDPFLLLSVGSYRRNFGALRQICDALRETEIRIVLVLPEEKKHLFDGLEKVQVYTNLTDAKLRSLYQRASCFLMTVEAATANNAILEAMACGLPIVSEAVGGIPEYVGRESGILYPQGSVREAVQAILKLYNDGNLVEQMGAAARFEAEKINWPAIGQKTSNVYDRIITEKRIPQ
jgi:glycosyltransferase involved in cell wall biosynthesis